MIAKGMKARENGLLTNTTDIMKNEVNKNLLNSLKELRQFIVNNIDVLPDSKSIRLNSLKAINDAEDEILKTEK